MGMLATAAWHCFFAVGALHGHRVVASSIPAKPHIIAIIIDDWGWNNFSYHSRKNANRAEVKTPNLEKLANRGVVLDRHYVACICTPSRSAFQTGRTPLHVTVDNGDLAKYNPDDPISGFVGIPVPMTGIAEKLGTAGYRTHFAGKWHAGGSSKGQIPKARGYSRSLAYLASGNNQWTYADYDAGGGMCGTGVSLIDLWEDDGPAVNYKPPKRCTSATQNGCEYEDSLFEARVSQTIQFHDQDQPLFLVWATHAVHSPLAPVNDLMDEFSFITDNPNRQKYNAAVKDIDMRVGRLVQTLQDTGMWSNTLIVVVADNGGPASRDGGASNYPLRGGKYGTLEGGIRGNAFVSGGFLPRTMRGKVLSGLVAIEDWYTTFCALAGVDPTDTKAAAFGLPPVDGLDMWQYISGANDTSPRTEVVSGIQRNGGIAAPQVVIDQQGYKLMVGEVKSADWSEQIGPTATTPVKNKLSVLDCGPATMTYPYPNACLFNVFTDPGERTNIAAQSPEIVARLALRLQALALTAFSPYRGRTPADKTTAPACINSMTNLAGYVGPFLA